MEAIRPVGAAGAEAGLTVLGQDHALQPVLLNRQLAGGRRFPDAPPCPTERSGKHS